MASRFKFCFKLKKTRMLTFLASIFPPSKQKYRFFFNWALFWTIFRLKRPLVTCRWSPSQYSAFAIAPKGQCYWYMVTTFLTHHYHIWLRLIMYWAAASSLPSSNRLNISAEMPQVTSLSPLRRPSNVVPMYWSSGIQNLLNLSVVPASIPSVTIDSADRKKQLPSCNSDSTSLFYL